MKKLLLITVLLSGCASPWQDSDVSLGDPAIAPPPPPTVPSVTVTVEPEVEVSESVGEITSVVLDQNIYDPVSEAVALMVTQLTSGLKANRIQRLPMAIMPFVDLSRARERHSGVLGERLGDSFIYQLQQGDYNLIDYRAVSLLTTARDPLTKQNLSSLRNRYRIYFLLTGTYARYPDGIVVNARVLDTTTRQVLASAQTHLPDVRLEGGTPGYDPMRALEKGMIVENSLGPVTP